MHKKLNAIFILGAMLGCIFSGIIYGTPLPTYNEKITTITQSVGEPTFMIELKSNRTTGYSWVLEAYDPTFIQLIKHQYLPPTTMIVGAAGVERWTFQLTKEAFASSHPLLISLVYKRPWEAKKPLKTVTFEVVTEGE